MTLKKYIKKTGLRQKEVAKDLKISETHLSLILSGKKEPGAGLCIRIEDWSKMNVTFRDLR